ncbi:FkbM family methyltransferase [Desulfonema ishimotonii]|nr:FkbM family methyltransferase [Desulfonema ishimotonii]
MNHSHDGADAFKTYLTRGNQFYKNKQLREAEECYRKAIELQPRAFGVYNNLGAVYRGQGKLDAAIRSFRRALALKPDSADMNNNIGALFHEQGHSAEAEQYFLRALQLNPNAKDAHYNLGLVYQKQGRLSEAIRSYQSALNLKSDYAEAHHNMGAVLIKQGRFEEAEASLDKALSIRPDYFKVNVDQALLLLLHGNLAEGWRKYEYRYRIKEAAYLKKTEPKWDGTPMPGKTLLVTYEQGLGDTLQFARYLPLARQRCGRLIFLCQKALRPLFEKFPGVDALADDADKARFDAGIGLLSLPHIFGTTLENIPADTPYIFAPPEKTGFWEKYRTPDWFNVGLVWAGNPRHQGDWNRSLHLSDFAPLAEAPHVVFHSLQVGQRSEEADTPPEGMHLRNFTRHLKNFADTAGLIEHLDLVITVDTSVAHLAGAMGKPVWMLVPYVPDWRWLLEREDTRWYPTMRLFRQPGFGNWKDVLDRMGRTLREWTIGEKGVPETRTAPPPVAVPEAPVSQVVDLSLSKQNHVPVAVSGVQPDADEREALDWYRQGGGWLRKKDYGQALQCFEKAVNRRPDYPEAWFNLGVIWRTRGNPARAVSCFERAVALAPANAEAHLGLGVSLQEQGRYDAALNSYEQALTLKPDHVEALIGIGIVLKELDRPDEALARYEEARRLSPKHVEVHKGLGMVLRELGQFEEALASYQKILEMAPNHAPVYVSIANTRKAMGHMDRAAENYRKAIALKPDYAEAHLFLGLLLLLQGRFAEGWREYAWRWKAAPLKSEAGKYAMPLWDGTSLGSRTILLHSEQGFGDSIQFVRYAAQVKAAGAKVVLTCEPPLKRLFEGIPVIDEVREKNTPQPPADAHASLLTLAQIFKTDAESIPAPVPYLSVDETIREKWRARVGDAEGLKVGIVWAGNPTHKKDRLRSIPPDSLEPVLNVPGVRFFSLQKGEQAEALRQHEAIGRRVTDLAPDLTDFAETAGAISALDLVISVDTAVAHLAGALGVPVWVLLPFVPDWRWLLEGEGTPWYPTMRLFRQTAHAQWEPVFERVVAALGEAASSFPEKTAALVPLQKSSDEGPGKFSVQLSDNNKNRADMLTDMKNQTDTNKITGIRQCCHGIMMYLRKDMYVGRSLELYGEFSEGETDIFRQLIHPGDVIIEAGANIGAHTVFLAKTVGPKGFVIAYEPQRFIHQILCANIALNEMPNVHARQAAVGSAEGRISVPALDYGQTYNFGGVSLGQSPSSGESVPVETIDSLKLPRLRLIKADVEGMESEVIRGGRNTIEKLRPVLYVENDRKEKSEALIALIQELNYRLWWHLPPLFNPNNFAGCRENVFGKIVSVNLLCIPRESPANITGLKEVKSPGDHWH